MSNAPQSFSVASTLTAYRIVTLSSTGQTVVYATAPSDKILGVTLDDVKETTQAIPVQSSGICKVIAGNSITVGALVGSDSTGQAIVYSDVTAGGYVLGVMVGNKAVKAGTLVDVLVAPFWKIIT
jgi:hypothetical protein